MKKILLPIMAVVALTMTSCGGASIEDVNPDDIKDACGCVDAMQTVTDIMVGEADKYDKDADKLEANADSKKLWESGMEKIEAIMKKCKKDLDVGRKEMKECDNYDAVDKNMDIIKDM